MSKIDDNNLSSNINDVNEDHSLTSNSSETVSYKSPLKNDSCICKKKDVDNPKKIEQIKNTLDEDVHSCDITWSLFYCALNSYRFDSCLRPFPPMFYNNVYKDVTRMRAIASQIPDMHTLMDTIDREIYGQETINLLHWVLVNQRDTILTLLADENVRPDIGSVYKNISRKQLHLPILPSYIFEVKYSKHQEEQFQKRKKNKNDSIYAFHGSRLDNFYSILKFGLQQHMSCNETLFGAGIYFSSELMLSLTYAPSGISWEKSCFGNNYSIVALCEIINDVENVKCQDVTIKRRSVNPGSIGGTVPNNYYVVLNNDLVRVRYLFVYEQSRFPKKIVQKKSKVFEYIRKNKMTIMLILYVLLLCFIGFLNSSFWHRIKRSIRSYFEDEII